MHPMAVALGFADGFGGGQGTLCSVGAALQPRQLLL
jgi:hypothetical protein